MSPHVGFYWKLTKEEGEDVIDMKHTKNTFKINKGHDK